MELYSMRSFTRNRSAVGGGQFALFIVFLLLSTYNQKAIIASSVIT